MLCSSTDLRRRFQPSGLQSSYGWHGSFWPGLAPKADRSRRVAACALARPGPVVRWPCSPRRDVGPSLRLALTGLRGRSRCTLPENLSLRIGRDQMGDGGAMAFNR